MARILKTRASTVPALESRPHPGTPRSRPRARPSTWTPSNLRDFKAPDTGRPETGRPAWRGVARAKEKAGAFPPSPLRHCRRPGPKPNKGTRLYTPSTSGKVERFTRTHPSKLAHAHAHQSTDDREARLPGVPPRHCCIRRRPHDSLNHQTPVSRLGLRVNKVARQRS